MIKELLTLVLVTFTPFLELRASIPLGILVLKLPVWLVFVVCIIANIILGFLTYFILDKVVHLLFWIKPFKKIYDYYVVKTQKKIHRYVEKYGDWALIAFIGVPLPGSGVIGGSLAGYIIGLSRKKIHMSIVVGVLIAAILVTAIVLAGDTMFSVFLKQV